MIDLCQTSSGDGGGGGDGRRVPTVLLRAEVDTLLGDGRYGAQLLTTLAGGRMRIDTATARRLIDRHGADLRLVLTDHGEVVGIGTRHRRPPGWLSDAVLAVHDTCTEPGCRTAARVCDLDHATPTAAGGATDVANLAPLCRTANIREEADGWRATQTPDGIRTWHHPRTGLTTTTIPTTWRPPPPPRDRPRAGPDDPDGPDPPHPC